MSSGTLEKRLPILSLGMAGVAIFMLWALFAVWLDHLRTDYRSSLEQTLNGHRNIIGEHVSGVFRISESFLAILVKWIEDNPEKDPRTDPGFSGLVREFQRVSNQSLLVRLVESDGFLHLVPAVPGANPAKIADRDYFISAMQKAPGEISISAPFQGRSTGRWAVAVATRLASPSHGIAVIFIALELGIFESAFEKVSLGEGGSVSLTRRDGVLLARMASDRGELGKDLSRSVVFTEGLSRQNEGVIFTDGKLTDGVPKLISYRALESYPLVVTVGRSAQEIARATRAQAAVVAAILLMVSILIAAVARQSVLIRRQAWQVQEERRFRETIIESIPGIFYALDDGGSFVFWNRNFELLTERSTEEVRRLNALELFAGEDQVLIAERIGMVFEKGESTAEAELVRKSGQRVPYFFTGRRIEMGGKPVLVGVGIDFTERRQTELELDHSRQKFATAFNSCPVAASITTLSAGRFIEANANYERDFGWTRNDLIGRTSTEVGLWKDEDSRNAWLEELTRTSGRLVDFETPWRHKNGELRQVSISCEVTQLEGQPCILAFVLDITERKKSEARILTLAFYDQLTGLANRALLMDRLMLAQAFAVRNNSYGALLFVDLDNFKDFNDTRGHDAGDYLLKEVALRMRNCVRDEDTIARVGSDEFVVVLSGLGADSKVAAGAAETISGKILSALEQPYRLGDVVARCTGSIGITLFKAQDVAIDDLLKQADIAMYRAKEMGRNSSCFFDPNMEESVRARVDMEHDLRQALEEGQFILHYQSQVLSDGRVTGAEALVRWRHPQRGMVSPADFIPLAEQTGLIIPLGLWVLEAACSHLADWAKVPTLANLTVAVNVSPRQFRQPDFADQVLAVLKKTGADPHRLKLELTESLMVHGIDETIEKMYRLKAGGIGFSLDDFGTGYSSLSYLKQLPLDQLKIDQSFVRDVLTDSNDAAIARTVVALAQSLGLSVIAEGVETEAQKLFLASNGCHAYQGFLFSRPVPAEEFVRLIAVP